MKAASLVASEMKSGHESEGHLRAQDCTLNPASTVILIISEG